MKNNRISVHGVLQFIILTILAISTIFQFIPIQQVLAAAPILTILPITWNVVGLDSNNVNVGPNTFPIGARVCNIGNAAATNVTSAYVWDAGGTDAGTYINLTPGSFINYNSYKLDSLAAGKCHEFFYEVQITRNASAYNKTRRYHITTSSTEIITPVSTPTPREIFVEHLISQNRNTTSGISYALGADQT